MKTILGGLREIIGEHRPQQVALEKVFVNVNPASTLALGQARGTAICAAVDAGLPVAEYTALQVKQAVVGNGHAKKEQVQEMVKRLQVPFEVLSDEHLAFTHALRLPTFTFNGMTLLKRLTLVARNGRIEHVFYPVFPPDTHAQEVIAWLQQHPASRG